MTLTHEERMLLISKAAQANTGIWPTLPPDLFQKLLVLADQAEAANRGPVHAFIKVTGAAL